MILEKPRTCSGFFILVQEFNPLFLPHFNLKMNSHECIG